MTDLPTLADRVAQAEGADADLFNDVCRTCYPQPATMWAEPGVTWTDEYRAYLERQWRFSTLVDAEAWLDAAVMLVPEGLRLMLSEWDDEAHLRAKGAWQAVLSKPGCDSSFDAIRGYRCDHAATPALALCAAALRARHASGAGEG